MGSNAGGHSAAGVAIAVVAGLAALTAAAAYAVAGRSSRVFGPSVYKGAGRRKSIALTFDDGPSAGTLELLEYLGSEGVHATFYQCGINVERYPEIVRAVHAGGHEIGNHTYSHPRLCPRLGWQPNIRSRQDIFDEFKRTQTLIEEAAGITPVLLRAPYGMKWFGLRQAQRRLGLMGVMWTVIGRDWELDAASIAELVLRRATHGGIVCLHDGRDIQPNPDIGQTLAAVKMIVPRLKQWGYTFETVSELLRADDAVAQITGQSSGETASSVTS